MLNNNLGMGADIEKRKQCVQRQKCEKGIYLQLLYVY